jgi:Flp pilus assembly protein CpaB
LVTRTVSRSPRPAAVSASTVFAIALAIVAGLIFAWLFKIVLLDKPKTQKQPDDTVEVVIAAGNIYDQTEIKPINTKKVKVPPKQRDAWMKSGKTLLTGSQPIGRVTRVPIKAEDPFYEEDMVPFNYPESVEKRLAKGMRPVILSIPAKEAMVQLNDYVDVYCTLSNDIFGPGSNGTAQIAKAAKVIARFGTTRPGAQPVTRDVPREYTLEVTPYRFALIELAKSMGAKFSLSVVPQVQEGDKLVAPPGNDMNDPKEQQADHVTGADLAALFGIGPTVPGPAPWEVEKYVGIKHEGKSTYPGYVPPSRGGNGTSGSPSTSPASSPTQGRSKTPAVPVAYTPPASYTPPAYNPTGAVASTQRNFGFKAPVDPNAGCKS